MKLQLKQHQSFSDSTVLPQSDQAIQDCEGILKLVLSTPYGQLCEQTPSFCFDPLDLVLFYWTPALRSTMSKYFSGESQQRLQDLTTELQQGIIDKWLQALIYDQVQGNCRIEEMLITSSIS